MKQTVLVKKGLHGYSRESVEAYIKDLDTLYTEKETAFNDRITELENALSEANAEKERLMTIIDDKTKEYEGLYGQFNELKAESRCMNDQIAFMHTKNYKLEMQNEKIHEQIEKIPVMTDALDRLLDAVRDELAKTVESLTAQADAFKAENIVKGVDSYEE